MAASGEAMTPMTIGSLFSGIGGLELGLEMAIPNAQTRWQVEQDAHAQKVLAKHWPNARRHNDVRQVGSKNLEPVDIICGGFPCQDLSIAGKQRGIDGARSGLWSEYARVIRELRPRYVVVENVTALLALGMGRVLGDLAACGYDAIWDCIPAAAVGAHHRRDRLYLVAYANSGCVHPEQKLRQKRTNSAESVRHGQARQMANADSARLEGYRQTRNARQICPQKATGLFRRSLGHVTAWQPESNVGRVADGIPDRVDRLKCLGNAVVPQVAAVIGRVIVELEGTWHQ